VNPALLFLLRRSAANWVRSRIVRLKSPRYLVPTLIGLAYFTLVFAPWRTMRSDAHAGEVEKVRQGASTLMEWGCTLLGFLLAAVPWVIPSRTPPLFFVEAEVAWLFPAPLTRKELVRYKLLDIQRPLLLSMTIFALMRTFQAGPIAGVMILLGGWLGLNVLTLHQIGARFTMQNLTDHGWSGFRRALPALLLIAALLTTVVLGAPPLPGDWGGRNFFPTLSGWLEQLGASPAGWVLYPFRLIVRPAFAPDLATFAGHSALLAAAGGLLYVWVMRSNVAFEEAAAAHAEVIARRLEAFRKGKGLSAAATPGKTPRRSPWRLASVGPPEIAFVWKSLTESLRGFSPRLIGILIVSVAMGLAFAMPTWSKRSDNLLPAIVGTISLAFACLLVIGGPSFLGTSLRADMENVEVLKSFPVPGARLVRCELAGTIAPTALLQFGLVLVAALVMPDPKKVAITSAWRISGTVGLCALLPALSLLTALADSAGVLYFPAWVRPGPAAMGGGVEGMGYQIVVGLAKLLLLSFGILLPGGVAAGMAAVAILVLGPMVAPTAVMLAAVLAATGILLEVYVFAAFLGRRFERLDPSAEGLIQ
jgi:hypothetical protein